ncbi:MAG: Ig domain-containing protein [Gemmatimonadaceae bacterium]|nr:Ig domain-containing protein [Gemmatimonadaceae bacterium]
MNFSRKTILVVGAALLAACGDKVTVQEYTPPPTTAKVNSVEVSPASATLNVGQTITMTAAVNADAGLATTVTWSSSDAGKASVSTAGVVTAVAATPGVAICATSTVDTGKKGCATVVVQPAAPTIPATVSINSITASGNLNGTVNPAAVAGAIDVTMNINPGNQTISKVELLFGGNVVYTQSFSAAQAASLRYDADQAVAAQSVFPQVVASFNTAAFNTTTGAPTWANGPYQLQAKLYTGSTTASASVAQTLTLANADGWWATVATSGTATNALNATGFRYDRGALTVSALPVSYSGSVVASGTVTFGSGACDASGTGARTTALVAPAAGTYAWTATFSQTAAPAAGNVNGYEFDGGLLGCTLNAIGQTPTVTAVNTAGDALFTAAAPLNVNALTGIRLDNRAPLTPTLIQNPNLRANGWINADVALTSLNTGATSNGVMIAPAAQLGCSTGGALDCGVGSTARFVRIAASAAGTVAEARLATPTSTPTLPAPSVTNLTYCGIFTYQDALGNEAALPTPATTACSAPAAGSSTALATNHMLFGVDIAPPTIAYTAASIAANNRRSGGTIGGEFIVTVNDTGLVGNSGMLPTSPVRMLIAQRVAGTTANSAGTINNLFANGTANAAGTLSATGVAAAAPLYSTAITGLTGAANHAYYTHSATAFDAAGNSASVSPRTMVYDNAAPVPGAPSTSVTLAATGYTANAFISEDLDIQDFSFGVSYGALAPFTSALAQIQMPMVAVNGFNAATFANTNYGVNAAVPMPLALQANVGAGLTNMAGLYTFARAQSNLGNQSGNFVPGVVTPGTAIPFGAPQLTTFPAVALPVGVTGVVTGNTTAAAAATPASVLLTATITGGTAVFNNPFSRIDFYMKDATGTRYFNVGSATVASLNDNGAVRTFTFTTTISGATVYALLGGAGATFASDIVAVGIGAANANIGMVAAGATAINVVF